MGAAIAAARIDAVIFDLDGVLVDTAELHAAAWKETFDELLSGRARAEGAADAETARRLRPFDSADYRRYVDGKLREDGITSFLRSRGIELPAGDAAGDPPGSQTVAAVGRQKNERFLRLLAERGLRPFDSSVRLVRRLRERGFARAVISASRNCAAILEAAGIAEEFDARVDGVDTAQLGLRGKPDPAVFLEAARRLGTAPGRAAIVEDALSGVEAGAGGGFAMVIGVDRSGHGDELRRAGATDVVTDLAEVSIER